MGTRTFGQWNETGRMLKVSNYEVQKTAGNALEKAAKVYYDEIMRLIEEGHPEWTPLTDEWKMEKTEGGFPPGHFKFKMEFKKRINIRKVKGSWSGQKIFVGATPYQKHRDSGMRMDEFAKVLQFKYGDRALFRRAYQNVEQELNQILADAGAGLFGG